MEKGESAMLIKGWVTPRYLDKNWYTTFSISKERKQANDIPVVVSVADKSYEGAKLGNDVKSYGDLEDEIVRLKARIVELVGDNPPPIPDTLDEDFITACPVPQMLHPLSSGWKQPNPQEIIFTPTQAFMTQEQCNALRTYDRSRPSGVYEGKMWKSNGHLVWFVNSTVNPDKCELRTRKIIIKEK